MPSKAIGIALLAVGIILLVYGISASDSFGSEVKEVFTGTPTDKSMWLIIGGVALGIIGLVAVARPGRRSPV
jgi:hypothetical protein